jgi:hypothetical protein
LGEKENLGDDFSLTKKEAVVWRDWWFGFDLIYFDAFGYRATGIMEHCNI